MMNLIGGKSYRPGQWADVRQEGIIEVTQFERENEDKSKTMDWLVVAALDMISQTG